MSKLAFFSGYQRRPATVARVKSARDQIIELAYRSHVRYEPAELDDLGNALAQLSDNPANLDDIEQTLLALERAGHLTAEEADKLHVAYLTAQ